MPRGDRTGPFGAGPMTGRGAGSCAGYEVPGYANPALGRGFGGGRGRGLRGGGRGWRHQFYATGLPGWARGNRMSYPNPEMAPFNPERSESAIQTQPEEIASLKEQTTFLKEGIEDLERRLSELQMKDGNSSDAPQKDQ